MRLPYCEVSWNVSWTSLLHCSWGVNKIGIQETINIIVLSYKVVSKLSFVQINQVLEVLQNIIYNFWASMSFLTKIKHKMKSPTHELLMGTQFWLEDWIRVPFYGEAWNTIEPYKNRNFPFPPLPPILSHNVQKKGQGNVVSLVRKRSW